MAEARQEEISGEDAEDALRINPFLAAHKVKKVEQNQPRKSTMAPPTQKVIKRLSKEIEEECYSNRNEHRGICLILEHDVFAPNLQLSERAGSNVDLRVANKCFTDLGFEVHIHRNLRYIDVTNLLEQLATEIDHSRSDCFVMILLSHGNSGTIYAYDAPYPTQKLWEPFTADRAPSLAGKPKFFFMQACQGNQRDEGIPITTQTDAGGFASYKVPMHADFLISHSTITGYYSWRNTAAGSWFIQSLVHILENKSNVSNQDVLSLLTLVNRRITKEYESNSSRSEFNHKKQTPFFYSTLTLKVFWDPKI